MVYSCNATKDCEAVLAGCLLCDDCLDHELKDPEVIAVNKNYYRCPEPPQNIAVCATCVGTRLFNQQDAVCINGRCVKKFSD